MTTLLNQLQFLQGEILQGQLLQGLVLETASKVGFLEKTLPLLQSSGGRAAHGAPPKEVIKIQGIDENLQKQEDERAQNEEDQAQQYSSLIKAAYGGELEEVRRTLQGNSEAIKERSQSGRSALHVASAKGHLEIVELLVRANLAINGQDEKGITPLRLAVASNHVQVTRFLLGQKAEPNIADYDDGWTPLHSAALSGHSDIIKCLMTSGADVTKQTRLGYTALFLASLNGHADCVKALVEVKEDTSAWDTGKYRDYLDMVDNAGLSALHCASLKGHANIVQTLIQKGASAGDKTESGMVPLTLAFAEGHLSCVRELLSSTDLDGVAEAITTAVARGHHIIFRYITLTTDQNNWSALHNAAWEGDDELLRSLIEDGQDINEQTPENEYTPLMLAIWQEHLQCVKILTVEGKADVNLSDKSNCSPLHIAVSLQNLDVMRLLLENGAQPDAIANEGKFPLHDACSKGDLNVIKLLLDAGANVNIKVSKEDSLAHTPLQFAAMGGHLESVRFLVDKGADIETPGSDRCSALLAAASRNQKEVITFLLTKNTNVDVADKNRNSLLFWAALYNNMDLLKKCLNDGGIDIDGKNSFGQTALHVASGFGHLEAVKLLVDKQASINTEDNETCTPLHNAAECNHADVVSYLLDYGADIERKDCGEQTPLHRAASLGCIDSVKTLVERGADIKAKDEMDSTPLHVAVAEFTGYREIDMITELGIQMRHGPREKRNNARCVEYLLDRGAEINALNEMGYTPFMNAARKAILDCAMILLARGADIDVKSKRQSTALHIAARGGHDEIIQLILEQDPGSEGKKARLEALNEMAFTPLQNAISREHVSSVRILCSYEAGLEIPGEDGDTPIFNAVARNLPEVVELLLNKGVGVNTPSAAYDNQTSLHMAVGNGYTDILKMLIDHGANLDARTMHDQNVYHIAAIEGKQECLNILIEAAKKEQTKKIPTEEMSPSLIDSTEKDGWTPIHFAILEEQMGCVHILCEAGADIEAQSSSGETPLQLATETEQVDIMKYLLERKADVNKCNNDGITALHIAAQEGLTEPLGILLESEADVNATSKDGFTPLFLSVSGGHAENASILLAYGSNVNAQTNTGNAAIHEAAERNELQILLCLIDNGATVDLTTNEGYTAAHFASKGGNTECLKPLLEKGADIEKQSNHGSSPVLLAAQHCHPDCVKFLVQHGADISKKDNDGDSLVHVAALGGKAESLEYVLDLDGMSALISSKNNAGQVPLHCAARKGHLTCVDILLALGVSQEHGKEGGPLVNWQDSQGRTALHLAVEGGFSSIIEALIEGGTDMNIKTYNGKTCLHFAATLCCSPDKTVQASDALEKVSSGHVEFDPLSGKEKLLLYLLDNGAKCTVFDENGNTPIQYTKTHRQWRLIISRIPEDERQGVLAELALESERIRRTAQKVIGPEGGEIHLSQYGVHLTIPPGALDQKQNISVKLLDALPAPGIQEDEMMASFGVELQPDGLRFKDRVQIRLPHCAIIDGVTDAKLVLYHYRGDVLTKHEVIAENFDEIPACTVRENELELYIDDFCSWFSCFGSWRAKRMNCYSFSRKDSDFLYMHIYWEMDVDGVQKDLENTEQIKGAKKVGGPGTLIVKRNNGDVHFAVMSGSEELKNKNIAEAVIKSTMQVYEEIAMKEIDQSKVLRVKIFQGNVTDFVCDRRELGFETPSTDNADKAPNDEEKKGEEDQNEAGYSPNENQQTRSEQLVEESDLIKLSKKLPHKNYTELCCLLNYEYNQASNILKKNDKNYEEAFIEVLMAWKLRETGNHRDKLIDVLNQAGVGGLIKEIFPDFGKPVTRK